MNLNISYNNDLWLLLSAHFDFYPCSFHSILVPCCTFFVIQSMAFLSVYDISVFKTSGYITYCSLLMTKFCDALKNSLIDKAYHSSYPNKTFDRKQLLFISKHDKMHICYVFRRVISRSRKVKYISHTEWFENTNKSHLQSSRYGETARKWHKAKSKPNIHMRHEVLDLFTFCCAFCFVTFACISTLSDICIIFIAYKHYVIWFVLWISNTIQTNNTIPQIYAGTNAVTNIAVIILRIF